MPFAIVRNDVTRMDVDAVVCSTGPLFRLGGAEAAIHRAAGVELRESLRQLGECKPGEPLVTPGFGLPCRYVIHTVAPVWHGGSAGEEQLLCECYRTAMLAAEKQGLESIAFPLMSSGLNGFPVDRAFSIAMDAIRDFVLTHDLMVYLAVYDGESFRIGETLHERICQYIDDRYVEEHGGAPDRPLLLASAPVPDACFDAAEEAAADIGEMLWDEPCAFEPAAVQEERAYSLPKEAACPPPAGNAAAEPWEAALRSLLREPDESFTQQLLRLIDESGMTDPECYRRANVDRRVFSKIRSNIRYQPSKQTAVAFAVALRLDLPRTEALLRTAGLALSRSSHFDLIVSYFIENGIYDVMTINEALYAFDQTLLGARG